MLDMDMMYPTVLATQSFLFTIRFLVPSQNESLYQPITGRQEHYMMTISSYSRMLSTLTPLNRQR